jgi:hypothetical protein
MTANRTAPVRYENFLLLKGTDHHFVGGGPFASARTAASRVSHAGYQGKTFPVRPATKSSLLFVAPIYEAKSFHAANLGGFPIDPQYSRLLVGPCGREYRRPSFYAISLSISIRINGVSFQMSTPH